ncbi:hypothetical protein TI39_contig5832g00035 [Zymoseptoria brevis]|uniref:DRBM domain-containing protein n=1 Tax=Zymoseptoria brevis TaxID=1047168 RepID=A0A0F4G5K8_9PEZI|nr:hypothetical protein TI39_contig5832g00035 [Zymoseptoria brevis]
MVLTFLTGVCQRRHWPSPHYTPTMTSSGLYHCKVRVNNREYTTEVPYASASLARDGAAQKAYMICRNFSVNDGMVPGTRPGQNLFAVSKGTAVQGLPVAIGSGRRGARNSGSERESWDGGSTTEGSSGSGGDSPRSVGSGYEGMVVSPTIPSKGQGRRRGEEPDGYVCYCRRGTVRAYGRCGWCLRENGWA